MPIIHKIVEGGEQYLGWALARERALRNQGGNRSIKHDFGDAEVEIRVVGNQSFVFVRSAGIVVPREWVCFGFDPDLKFSAVNDVGTNNGPQGGQERPTPPAHPGCPDEITVTMPPDPTGYEPEEYDRVSEASRVAAGQAAAAARLPLREAWEAAGSPSYPMPSVPVSNGIYKADETTAAYDSSRDYMLVWYRDAIAAHQEYLANVEACNAITAAHQAALVVWTNTVLADWEAQNFPSQVCPPYFVDLLTKQRAGRAAQIAVLPGEIAQGMKGLVLFNPAMHPEYVPREEPAEPLYRIDGPDPFSQSAWVEPGKYETAASTFTSGRVPPAVGTCEAEGAASITVSNVYTGVRPYQYPGGVYAGHVSDLRISLSQAFGYTVSGTIRDKEKSAPQATATPVAVYDAWQASARHEGQYPVSFELFPGDQTGEAFFATFEFEVYDEATEMWQWMPTIQLVDVAPVNSCYSLCYSWPDTERNATYTNRPSFDQSVRAMRSTGFFKHTRTKDGVWSAPQTIVASPISVDLLPLVGLVYGRALPAVICALRGLREWMLPKVTNYNTAVDLAHMAAARIPASVADLQAPEDFMHWLYAQCLSRFQIPFK